MRDALTFVTDFADQAVILPLLAAVAAVLAVQRRWRLSGAWLVSVCGVLATTLMLKVALYACGWLIPSLGHHQLALISPSGHTASAAVEYGGLAALLSARSPPVRWGPLGRAALAGLSTAAVVGFTRIELGAHTVAEVIVAAAVGLLGTAAFVLLAGPAMVGKSALPAILAGGLVLGVFHGRHLPAEVLIQSRAAAVMRQLAPFCTLQPEREGKVLAPGDMAAPGEPVAIRPKAEGLFTRPVGFG